MSIPEVDLKYSYDLLDRLTCVRVDGKEISTILLREKYNAWQMYRHTLMFHVIPEFSRYKDYVMWKQQHLSNKKKFVPIKNFVLYCVSIVITFFAGIYLVLARKQVVVFSGDIVSSTKGNNDVRLNPIYDFLRQNDIPFTEFFYTLLGKRFVKNFIKRKRSALYLQSFDAIYKVVRIFSPVLKNERAVDLGECPGLSNSEKKFAHDVVVGFLHNVSLWEFRIKILERILRMSQVKVALSIDDASHYNDFIVACKEAHIKVYALQHGHYSKYEVGQLKPNIYSGEIVRPDKLFVWSDYWRNELIRLGTSFGSDQIFVCSIREPTEVIRKGAHGNYINILIPYETFANKKEVPHYIKLLLNCAGTHIYFKLRPDRPVDTQLEQYGFRKDFHKYFHVITDIKEIIDEVDIVVGTYSTFLYEMVERLKPVGILDTDLDYGEGMVLNGLASKITEQNICLQINTIKDVSNNKLHEKRDMLCGTENPRYSDVLGNELRNIGVIV